MTKAEVIPTSCPVVDLTHTYNAYKNGPLSAVKFQLINSDSATDHHLFNDQDQLEA
jgi:hypothetical protein